MAVRGETKVNKEVLPRRITARAWIPGTAGAAAASYGPFWTAPPVPGAAAADLIWEVTYVVERHQVLGTDAGAVSVDVRVVPSGTAKTGGVSVLAATINLKAAADTNQVPALNATVANLRMKAGDSLALNDAGVLTAVSGVLVTVELKRI